MIKVSRPALTKATGKNYLSKKDAEVQAQHALNGFSIHNKWKSARQTMSIGKVFDVLKTMTTPEQRCMYCAASIAGDIEHFWPKANYPAKTFKWENMLACCTDCGRVKNNQFPLDNNGQPLLIDPSVENPWIYIEFDSTNGNLTAKFDLNANNFFVKGTKTVEVLHLDKREAIAESYLRSYTRICDVIERYLQIQTTDQELLGNLRLADENSLLEWCFVFNGQNLHPLSDLKNQFRNTWNYIISTF